ncbi:MAG: 2-oxo acid dehydrogenase subunit E2, partial [Bacteroidota bacterium]|nr:2-oxo acid dehydrogenase subunit E2 [Bacteroidota bacterium]
MATIDLVMPKLGESIMEATILKWHKQPGDFIKMDETLLEIATDKVDSEVPSTTEGIVEEILYQVNDVVPIGAVIAKIKTEAGDGVQDTDDRKEDSGSKIQGEGFTMQEEKMQPVIPIHESTGNTSQTTNTNGRFYSPLVLNIAASEGVSMTELENITGTGNEGRVTKKDILQFVSYKKADKIPTSHAPRVTSHSDIVLVKETQHETQGSQIGAYSGNVEIIEMDRMRKLIADHMVRSKHTSPHVTSFTESDVSNMVMWRDKVKKDFEKREGTKISFTPLFI